MAEKDRDKQAEMVNAMDMRRGASLARQLDSHPSDEVWYYSVLQHGNTQYYSMAAYCSFGKVLGPEQKLLKSGY